MGPATARPAAWGQLAAEPGMGAQALGKPGQVIRCFLLRLFIRGCQYCVFGMLSVPDIPAGCLFPLLLVYPSVGCKINLVG